MRYILKYKDKEDFLEENPKEEVKLPIMWKYPREECTSYYMGNVEYDSNTGEVTSYEEPVLNGSDYVYSFREDGKNDIFVITPDGEENGPYFSLRFLKFAGGASISSDEPFIPGNLYYALGSKKSLVVFQRHLIPLTSSTQFFYEEQPNTWANKYSGFTFSAGEYGSISAETVEEYGYSGGTGGFYPTSRKEHKNFLRARSEDDDFLVYVAPTGAPVSSYTRIARIIDLVQDNETNIPAALLEPNENGFLVTNFMMGGDVSSCGYTATKGQWFGMCLPIMSQNPGIFAANASTEPAPSFQEFYTDNETGMTEMTYYNNGNITGKRRLYYTIFYLTGDTGSTPIVTYDAANPNASDIILGLGVGEETEPQGTRIPFYALTREHYYESGSSVEYVVDAAYDGVYDLYMYIKYTGGTYNSGYELSGYAGTITVVNEGGLKKDSVTKVEPGFAHVLTPDSVYYNNLSKDSGGSSDFVIPGASTDAPGSKIPLTVSEGGGGQQE